MVSKQRSYNMSRIKSKDTSIELKVRKYLYHKGYRYQKNVETLPGTPDIYILKYNVAIFINGCFWHGHECNRGHLPETNREFWAEKIHHNVERDQCNYEECSEKGWEYLVIWQCDIKISKLEDLKNELTNFLQ